jgi:hypothetical protein
LQSPRRQLLLLAHWQQLTTLKPATVIAITVRASAFSSVQDLVLVITAMGIGAIIAHTMAIAMPERAIAIALSTVITVVATLTRFATATAAVINVVIEIALSSIMLGAISIP